MDRKSFFKRIFGIGAAIAVSPNPLELFDKELLVESLDPLTATVARANYVQLIRPGLKEAWYHTIAEAMENIVPYSVINIHGLIEPNDPLVIPEKAHHCLFRGKFRDQSPTDSWRGFYGEKS